MFKEVLLEKVNSGMENRNGEGQEAQWLII